MESNAFLRFINDYSYPIVYYSFLSAEDEITESTNDSNDGDDSRLYFLTGFSAKLIHTTLQKSCFVQTDDFHQASLIVGSKSNEDLQKYLKPYQRMTHYLFTQVIGQKVGLHTTLSRFMNIIRSSLPFYPKTFLIPQQFNEFKKSVASSKFWIEKPSCGSCGRGITIVEGMPEKFITRQVIMQEYIRNPLLIHGYKFDLRFYVAVTSLNPLRIYNYNDGLVRFATDKYALFFEDVTNLSAHLTNFSINKESEKFHVTNDVKDDGKGSKWSHVPFWPFLDNLNFDVDQIKEKIDDAIATVIFSARNELALQNNHRTSFELYGFDVLLTVDGEIHILEVNISPALGTSSNLDMHIKAPLVRDLFNLALVPVKSDQELRIEEAFTFENNQLFESLDGQKEKNSNQNLNQNQNIQDSICKPLSSFSPSVLSDVASLASVCEFEIAEKRLGGFRRIYPTLRRSQKFDEMRGCKSMKTRLDRVLEDWIKNDENGKEDFIKSMLPSYRTFLGDLVSFPREHCSIA